MTGVAVPFPQVTSYTFSAATGLTLTGSNVTWTPNTLTTKAVPLGTDFAAGYDVAGAAAAKFLLSTLPVSVPQQAAIDIAQKRYRSVINQAASRDLALTDAGSLIFNFASNIVLNIPTNATVPFVIGDKIDLLRAASATFALSAAGGVTINNASGSGSPQIAGASLGASLTYLGGDLWWLVGGISA